MWLLDGLSLLDFECLRTFLDAAGLHDRLSLARTGDAELRTELRRHIEAGRLVAVHDGSEAAGFGLGTRGRGEPVAKGEMVRETLETSVPASVRPRFAISLLTVPPVFAPGAEVIEFRYVFEDPAGVGEVGVLELFADGISGPVWARDVPAADLAAKHGRWKWDGKVDRRGPAFPDEYATLEHSPYRLRLTARGAGCEDTKTCSTTVALADLVVALAPVGCLKHERDRRIHKQVGVLPGRRCLMLEGNVFAQRSAGADPYAELGSGADVGHRFYSALWDGGAGPRLPITLTVRVRSSDGRAVVAGKAMGRARVLWDYVDARASPAGAVSEKSKAYLDRVAAYESAQARPRGGGNAPRRLGGKRAKAPLGDRAVLGGPDGGVHDFPFSVTPAARRFWAALGKIEGSGAREAQSGVVFRPSIVAGDVFMVRAYLDIKESLDVDGDLPVDAPSIEVGAFEIWRQVSLTRRIRKCEEVPDVVPDATPFFNTSFISLDNRLRTNAAVMARAEYEIAFRRAWEVVRTRHSEGFSKVLIKYALPEGVSQYDHVDSGLGRFLRDVVSFFGATRSPTTWVAAFRGWGRFVDAVKNGRGLDDTGTLSLLRREQIANSFVYAQQTELLAVLIAVELAVQAAVEPGVTVLQFDQVHSLQDELGWKVAGVAALTTAHRDRSAFAAFGQGSATFAHELGHCLFLPHAPSQPNTPITGVVGTRHVDGDIDCLMAYGHKTGLCAVCMLRLRGCDGGLLDSTGVIPPGPILDP